MRGSDKTGGRKVRVLGKARDDIGKGMAAAMATIAMTMANPALALAITNTSKSAKDANTMLKTFLGYISTAVIIGGVVLIVWGGVRLGLAIKEHQGGSQMSEAVFTLGGGVVITVAGGFFATIGNSYSFK